MTLFEIPVATIDGVAGTLEPYRGKVLLIVNVASKCSFTRQYAGLEALYQKYHERGFEVLSFPCDQFLNQEPGSEAEIKAFCSLKYAVTFPMFAKVKVNGADAHPLYQYLKTQQHGTLGTESIKWNFTKFLVDRSGNVVRRFGMFATPSTIDKHVEQLLR